MDEEKFTAHRIQGQSHPSGFCKTRCGNEKFYNWYLSTIVTAFVIQCRSILLNENYSNNEVEDRFYIVADDEEVQLSPLDNDDIANLLEDEYLK
jgi:hypothetical protein